jgi:hypothetical protein
MMELSRQKVSANNSSIEIISEEEKEEEEEISFSHSGFTIDEGMTWAKKDIDFWYHANQIIVRGYRGMLCEDAWSNLADLRFCEPRAIGMRSAGGSAGMRRCPI